MDIKSETIEKIVELNNQIADLHRQVKQLKDDYAETFNIKVNDVVTWNNGNRKGRIDWIKLNDRLEVERAQVVRILKSGIEGSTVLIYSWDWKDLKKVED